MSRATAAPAQAPAPPAVAPGRPATPTAVRRTGSASAPEVTGRRSARGALASALEGTPGRMRLLGFVAALAAAVFGVVAAMSLWSSANALERANHNTEQVVRIQGIYADLVKADATATNAFLVGGLEDATQRAAYDSSIDSVATGIAAAAQAQPADGEALGVLNTKVQTYVANVEQARVYNRQGLPVGAQYINEASASLRSDVLPVINALIGANRTRADQEFDASSRLTWVGLAGVLALVVLALVMVWLARRTHRYVNPAIGTGTLIVVAALVVGLLTIIGIGNRVRDVRTNDFAGTVALATIRSTAYDAKANESLTLIYRGSGQSYEDRWTTQSNQLRTDLNQLDSKTQTALQAEWIAYVTAHQAIRAKDAAGDWDGAVALARDTGAGSANATFTAFTTDATAALQTYQDRTSDALLGFVPWVTVLGWLLLAACVLAALLVVRGMGQRVEEYR